MPGTSLKTVINATLTIFLWPGWSGTPIIAKQTSPESEDLLELFFLLFEKKKNNNGLKPDIEEPITENISKRDWSAFLDFVVFVIGNIGNYKCIGNAKVFPNLSSKVFDRIVMDHKNEEVVIVFFC